MKLNARLAKLLTGQAAPAVITDPLMFVAAASVEPVCRAWMIFGREVIELGVGKADAGSRVRTDGDRGPKRRDRGALQRHVVAVNASLKRTFQRRAPAKRAAATAADHAIEELKNFMPAALPGHPTPDVPKKRVAPGALPLELTDREWELVLKHSFAPDELTRQLRVVPPPGEPVVARYTLDDLDDPAGYVASESSHSKDRKLHKEWERIYVTIAAILESHTDEKERSTR